MLRALCNRNGNKSREEAEQESDEIRTESTSRTELGKSRTENHMQIQTNNISQLVSLLTWFWFNVSPGSPRRRWVKSNILSLIFFIYIFSRLPTASQSTSTILLMVRPSPQFFFFHYCFLIARSQFHLRFFAASISLRRRQLFVLVHSPPQNSFPLICH